MKIAPNRFFYSHDAIFNLNSLIIIRIVKILIFINTYLIKI